MVLMYHYRYMKNTIIVILLVIIGVFAFYTFKPKQTVAPTMQDSTTTQSAFPTQTSTSTATTSQSSANQTQQTTTVSTTLPSFIGGQEGWPPTVTYSSSPYSCTTGATGMGVKTVTKEININGRTYCVQISDEGAAGTVYYTYTYTTANTSLAGGGTMSTHFTLGFHDTDCTKIGTAENISCQADQPSFNVDTVIDSLMQGK